MLVYENYNRFISATDTIRTMKAHVDAMDASMTELETVTGALPPPASSSTRGSQFLSDICEQTHFHCITANKAAP